MKAVCITLGCVRCGSLGGAFCSPRWGSRCVVVAGSRSWVVPCSSVRRVASVRRGVGSAPVVVSSVGSLLALASCSPCSVFVPVRFPFCLAPVFSVLRFLVFFFSFARCSLAGFPFGSPALLFVVASGLARWGCDYVQYL